LLGAAVMPRAAAPHAAGDERDGAGLLQATLRPGLGLMLVNVGYAALLAFGGARTALAVPAFALTVIAARATLAAAAPTAAVGLTLTAFGPAVLGVVLLGAGQALAVPALGLLAL